MVVMDVVDVVDVVVVVVVDSPTPTTNTTTTLPTSCAGEPIAPTFRSLNCRLATLIEQTTATEALGALRKKLLVSLGKAKERKEMAESQCAAGETKQPKARLKQVIRQLVQYAHRLRSNSTRKRTPEAVREPLARAADAIRDDARTLRSRLACPADARA